MRGFITPLPHTSWCGAWSSTGYFFIDWDFFNSRDSSVGIALGYGLDDRGSRVRFSAEAENFSLHHRVQNGSGAHPVSYPTGTRGFFPGVKRLGREADQSLPSSAEVEECLELYLHSHNMASWRGAQLKHRDNFTLLYFTLLYFTLLGT
jgi:hypothetical protein